MMKANMMKNGVAYKSRHKGTCGRSNCNQMESHRHLWWKGKLTGKVVEVNEASLQADGLSEPQPLRS